MNLTVVRRNTEVLTKSKAVVFLNLSVRKIRKKMMNRLLVLWIVEGKVAVGVEGNKVVVVVVADEEVPDGAEEEEVVLALLLGEVLLDTNRTSSPVAKKSRGRQLQRKRGRSSVDIKDGAIAS